LPAQDADNVAAPPVRVAPEGHYMDAARALNLLHLGEQAGAVYWKPRGLRLYENLRQFIRQRHLQWGYEEVKTPSLVPISVFERSGHLAKYRDFMFILPEQAQSGADVPQAAAAGLVQELAQGARGQALRPMNCPSHIEIYASERRSYRQLPYRLFEFGEVFRHESAGALQVLFRQRQFCQDDSHVFVAPNQIQAEVARYLRLARQVYAELGFEKVEVNVSLRPEMRFGDDEAWQLAEDALRMACKQAGLEHSEEPGGGAFYGPKVELGVRDRLGRRWQLGTIQLDYVLPERFELEFVDEHDRRCRPVMLHHAVLGSLERMLGVLLEVYGVALPVLLHPLSRVVLAVSDKSAGYADQLCEHLRREQGLAAHLDVSSGKLGAKLRAYRLLGVPEIFVVGEAEAQRHAQDGIWRANINHRGQPRAQPWAGQP